MLLTNETKFNQLKKNLKCEPWKLRRKMQMQTHVQSSSNNSHLVYASKPNYV